MKPNTRIRNDRSEYKSRDRTRSRAAKRTSKERRAQRALKGSQQ